MRTRLQAVLAATCLALAPFSQAVAQSYPSKPIHIIVAFAPGGPVDVGPRRMYGRTEPLGEVSFVRILDSSEPPSECHSKHSGGDEPALAACGGRRSASRDPLSGERDGDAIAYQRRDLRLPGLCDGATGRQPPCGALD